MNKTASYTLLGLGAAALLTFGVFLMPKNENVQANGEGLTRTDVEDIVREFISNNPDVIIESLNSYQEKQRAEQEARAREGVKNMKGKISGLDMPFAGNPDGDVTVVEFFDYNCGFCRRVQPNVQKLIEQDDEVKVLFVEFPILSPASEQAARSALAVHQIAPDKYFDYHNKLMNHSGQKNEAAFVAIASELGIDTDKMKAEMTSDAVEKQLQQARELATEIGIRGTPAFVIGDDLIPGAIDYDALKSSVEKARKG